MQRMADEVKSGEKKWMLRLLRQSIMALYTQQMPQMVSQRID